MGGYRGFVWIIQLVFLVSLLTGLSTDVLEPDVCNNKICTCDELNKLVDCSGKQLPWMPKIPTWTEKLTLASNSFTTIQTAIFYSNKNLKILNLENNQISEIEPNAFQNLYQLEVLILKDNRLTEIKSDSFHHLTELRTLDLRNNQLRNIAEDAFKLVPQISRVTLNGNRLWCDCSTVRLYQSFSSKTDVLEMAQCKNYQNKLISAVINEQLITCGSGLSVKQDYEIQMVILEPWDPNYGNAITEKANALSNRVTSELKKVLEGRPRSTYKFVSVGFKKSADTFIEAKLQMECTLPPHISVPWYRDEIYFLIKDAATSEKFTFGIDTSQLFIIGNNFCSSSIPRKTDAGLVWWHSQLPGQTSVADCPENPEQKATIKCNSIPVNWDYPNTTMCQPPSNRTKGLEELSQKPITNETLPEVAQGLANLTENISDFKHREVSLVADITQNCLSAPNVPVVQETAAQLVASVNKMLAVESDTLVNAEIESNATTRLVQSIERVGSKVEGSAEGVKIVEPQLGVLITKPPTDTGLLFETVGHVGDDLNVARMRVRPSGSSLPDLTGNAAAVHLPPSVLERGENTTNIHFALYNSASFFIAAEIANQSTPGNLSRDISSQYVLNSRVVSAKVGNQDVMNLKDPVIVTLRHISDNSSKHVCVYWDYDLGGWSADGCKVTSSRDYTTTCQCNHLTNFALLLDIYGKAASLPEIHKTVLSFISYIGCGISATGLILTLLTYLSFRRMLRDNPSKILVNLCVALLGITIAFIFTTQVFVRNNVIACKFFAALTHYFLLAAMAWMSVEAFYMYIAIVRVFHTYYSKFLLKCCLIGWGIPLVAVAITVAISRDNYGKQGEICWLPRIPFFAAVLGPVALTLLLNSIAFGLVINQLRQMDSRKLEKSKRSNILSRLRGAMSIMVLLGLTWVFAFLTVGPGGIVFTYLFAISNSLQGLFIFVFYCLLKRDAQQAWMNCFGCERPGSASSSRDTMSYSTRSEVKPKPNSVKPLRTEEYYPDEHSSPGYVRRKSCFGGRPDVRKTFTVSEQSNVTTSTTDSSTLVEAI